MKQPHKTALIFIIALIFLIAIVSLALYLIYNTKSPNCDNEVYVIEVIDGDTFKLSDNTIVRLLCVDTPEKNTDSLDYDRSIKFLESLILLKEVKLEKPETLETTDKYNRELRFVYVNTSSSKEIFINKEIIRLGIGNYYPYQDTEGECKRVLV